MKKVIFSFTIFVLSFFSGFLLFSEEQKKEPIPEIKDVAAFWYACMEFKGSYSQMEKNIGIFMNEFFKQGLIPGGQFLGVYYNNPDEVKEEELKWAVGFPVPSDANVQPPLSKTEFKNIKAVVYLHIGPYEKMGESYNKVFKYIENNGYRAIWPVYDRYLNNPQVVKPEELETEIVVPVEKVDK